MRNLIIIGVVVVVLLIILSSVFYFTERNSLQAVASFEDCVAGGYPVMESYPRQCRTPDGRSFVEEVQNGNQIATTTGKENLIIVTFPKANDVIKTPLTITGQARGFWFFEASFPVYLRAENGETLASGIATAEGEWMTEEFVPFTATLTFDAKGAERGVLVLEKDNPSGLPENADSLQIPLNFEDNTLGACIVTGCSSQVCADEEVATTCEFKAEYACFKQATCERQANGQCGWTETAGYNQCIQNL